MTSSLAAECFEIARATGQQGSSSQSAIGLAGSKRDEPDGTLEPGQLGGGSTFPADGPANVQSTKKRKITVIENFKAEVHTAFTTLKSLKGGKCTWTL